MNQILADHPEIKDVKPLSELSDGTVVMVVLMPEYIQLAQAQAPVIVPHLKTVELQSKVFTAYACMAPIIHVDNNGLTGLVVGSTA
jgi:hypothetical protein